MKALLALRKAFSLTKNEELGRMFPPETLRKILDAMKDYASSKCDEQRVICQKDFDAAYRSDAVGTPFDDLYFLGQLKESETPDLD